MTSFTLNGKSVSVDDDPSTPLLWVIRDSLGLTGTKFGCGMALCGACTVHLEGNAIRSCVAPLSRVAGKHVTTIEGLSTDNSHPVQRAWIEIDVPQCGYCQSGQIMSAVVLLKDNPKISAAALDKATAEAKVLNQSDVLILSEVDWGMGRSDYRQVALDLASALKMNFVYGVEFAEVDPLKLGTDQLISPCLT